jgi:hypothetical protein
MSSPARSATTPITPTPPPQSAPDPQPPRFLAQIGVLRGFSRSPSGPLVVLRVRATRETGRFWQLPGNARKARSLSIRVRQFARLPHHPALRAHRRQRAARRREPHQRDDRPREPQRQEQPAQATRRPIARRRTKSSSIFSPAHPRVTTVTASRSRVQTWLGSAGSGSRRARPACWPALPGSARCRTCCTSARRRDRGPHLGAECPPASGCR